MRPWGVLRRTKHRQVMAGLIAGGLIRHMVFQVQDYKDSLKQKAEHLIIKGFPEKIVKLNELLETSNFQNRDLSDVHQVR